MTKTTTISAIDIDENNEDLIHTKTVFRRHSKGPVMFNGCAPSGDVIIIDNISTTKSYDLAGWHIERQTDTQPMLRYTFLCQFIIPPLTTVELWSSAATPVPMSPDADDQQQQSFIGVRTKILTWNTARQWSTTRLFDHKAREKAIFSHRTLTSEDKE